MDRIQDLISDEIHVSPENLKEVVSTTENLKDQILDLVVDAEKGSKRKVFGEEHVDEADMIICNLLYKEDETYDKKMEELSQIRVNKLSELGLN